MTSDVSIDKSSWDLEIAHVRQSGGSDDSQVRQAEMPLVELADISSTRLVPWKCDSIANASRDHSEFVLTYE